MALNRQSMGIVMGTMAVLTNTDISGPAARMIVAPTFAPTFATTQRTAMMTEGLPVRRWDLLVKLTHWAIVLAVLANALLFDAGSAAHIWVGYALAAVLCLRLLWGLVGPAEARFTAFPFSPGRALVHLKEIAAGKKTAHRSHNPLGALMVYAIWGTLLVIIATGIAMAGPPSTIRLVAPTQAASMAKVAAAEEESEGEGNEASEGGDSGERDEGFAGEVHEAAVNLLYGLILLHIAGVAFESRRQRRNLALAMLPGQR